MPVREPQYKQEAVKAAPVPNVFRRGPVMPRTAPPSFFGPSKVDSQNERISQTYQRSKDAELLRANNAAERERVRQANLAIADAKGQAKDIARVQNPGAETITTHGGGIAPKTNLFTGEQDRNIIKDEVRYDGAGRPYQTVLDETGGVKVLNPEKDAKVVSNKDDPEDTGVYFENKASPWTRVEPEQALFHPDKRVGDLYSAQQRKRALTELADKKRELESSRVHSYDVLGGKDRKAVRDGSYTPFNDEDRGRAERTKEQMDVEDQITGITKDQARIKGMSVADYRNELIGKVNPEDQAAIKSQIVEDKLKNTSLVEKELAGEQQKLENDRKKLLAQRQQPMNERDRFMHEQAVASLGVRVAAWGARKNGLQKELMDTESAANSMVPKVDTKGPPVSQDTVNEVSNEPHVLLGETVKLNDDAKQFAADRDAFEKEAEAKKAGVSTISDEIAYNSWYNQKRAGIQKRAVDIESRGKVVNQASERAQILREDSQIEALTKSPFHAGIAPEVRDIKMAFRRDSAGLPDDEKQKLADIADKKVAEAIGKGDQKQREVFDLIDAHGHALNQWNQVQPEPNDEPSDLQRKQEVVANGEIARRKKLKPESEMTPAEKEAESLRSRKPLEVQEEISQGEKEKWAKLTGVPYELVDKSVTDYEKASFRGIYKDGRSHLLSNGKYVINPSVMWDSDKMTSESNSKAGPDKAAFDISLYNERKNPANQADIVRAMTKSFPDAWPAYAQEHSAEYFPDVIEHFRQKEGLDGNKFARLLNPSAWGSFAGTREKAWQAFQTAGSGVDAGLMGLASMATADIPGLGESMASGAKLMSRAYEGEAQELAGMNSAAADLTKMTLEMLPFMKVGALVGMGARLAGIGEGVAAAKALPIMGRVTAMGEAAAAKGASTAAEYAAAMVESGMAPKMAQAAGRGFQTLMETRNAAPLMKMIMAGVNVPIIHKVSSFSMMASMTAGSVMNSATTAYTAQAMQSLLAGKDLSKMSPQEMDEIKAKAETIGTAGGRNVAMLSGVLGGIVALAFPKGQESLMKKMISMPKDAVNMTAADFVAGAGEKTIMDVIHSGSMKEGVKAFLRMSADTSKIMAPHIIDQAAEMFVFTVSQELVAKATYNPNITVGEIVHSAIESAGMGALMGVLPGMVESLNRGRAIDKFRKDNGGGAKGGDATAPDEPITPQTPDEIKAAVDDLEKLHGSISTEALLAGHEGHAGAFPELESIDADIAAKRKAVETAPDGEAKDAAMVDLHDALLSRSDALDRMAGVVNDGDPEAAKAEVEAEKARNPENAAKLAAAIKMQEHGWDGLLKGEQDVLLAKSEGVEPAVDKSGETHVLRQEFLNRVSQAKGEDGAALYPETSKILPTSELAQRAIHGNEAAAKPASEAPKPKAEAPKPEKAPVEHPEDVKTAINEIQDNDDVILDDKEQGDVAEALGHVREAIARFQPAFGDAKPVFTMKPKGTAGFSVDGGKLVVSIPDILHTAKNLKKGASTKQWADLVMREEGIHKIVEDFSKTAEGRKLFDSITKHLSEDAAWTEVMKQLYPKAEGDDVTHEFLAALIAGKIQIKGGKWTVDGEELRQEELHNTPDLVKKVKSALHAIVKYLKGMMNGKNPDFDAVVQEMVDTVTARIEELDDIAVPKKAEEVPAPEPSPATENNQAAKRPSVEALVKAGLPNQEAEKLVKAWDEDTEVGGGLPSVDRIVANYNQHKTAYSGAETIKQGDGSLADYIENLEVSGLPKKAQINEVVKITGMDRDDVGVMIDAVRRFRGIPSKPMGLGIGPTMGGSKKWDDWRAEKQSKAEAPKPAEATPKMQDKPAEFIVQENSSDQAPNESASVPTGKKRVAVYKSRIQEIMDRDRVSFEDALQKAIDEANPVGATTDEQPATDKLAGDVAEPAAEETRVKSRVSAVKLSDILAPSDQKGRRISGAMRDAAGNYETESGVEVSLSDEADIVEINGEQFVGDVSLEVIAVPKESNRNNGAASRELKRILMEVDNRDMSISLTVDPSGAQASGIHLSEKKLVEWYARHGFVFDGLVGYRPRKSEDASKLVKRVKIATPRDASEIENQLNADSDERYFSDPQTLFEIFESDPDGIPTGYIDGGDAIYYYDGKSRPIKVDNVIFNFKYGGGRHTVELTEPSAESPAPTTEQKIEQLEKRREKISSAIESAVAEKKRLQKTISSWMNRVYKKTEGTITIQDNTPGNFYGEDDVNLGELNEAKRAKRIKAMRDSIGHADQEITELTPELDSISSELDRLKAIDFAAKNPAAVDSAFNDWLSPKAESPAPEAENTTKTATEEPFDFGRAGREVKERYDKAVAESEGFDGVEMESPTFPGMKVLITKDPSEQGKWRATRVDSKGPSGHNVFDSKEDAIADYTGMSKSIPFGRDFKVTKTRNPVKTSANETQGLQDDVKVLLLANAATHDSSFSFVTSFEDSGATKGEIKKLTKLGFAKKDGGRNIPTMLAHGLVDRIRNQSPETPAGKTEATQTNDTNGQTENQEQTVKGKDGNEQLLEKFPPSSERSDLGAGAATTPAREPLKVPTPKGESSTSKTPKIGRHSKADYNSAVDKILASVKSHIFARDAAYRTGNPNDESGISAYDMVQSLQGNVRNTLERYNESAERGFPEKDILELYRKDSRVLSVIKKILNGEDQEFGFDLIPSLYNKVGGNANIRFIREWLNYGNKTSQPNVIKGDSDSPRNKDTGTNRITESNVVQPSRDIPDTGKMGEAIRGGKEGASEQNQELSQSPAAGEQSPVAAPSVESIRAMKGEKLAAKREANPIQAQIAELRADAKRFRREASDYNKSTQGRAVANKGRNNIHETNPGNIIRTYRAPMLENSESAKHSELIKKADAATKEADKLEASIGIQPKERGTFTPVSSNKEQRGAGLYLNGKAFGVEGRIGRDNRGNAYIVFGESEVIPLDTNSLAEAKARFVKEAKKRSGKPADKNALPNNPEPKQAEPSESPAPAPVEKTEQDSQQAPARDASRPEQMTPDEFAAYEKEKLIAHAKQNLDWAKRGVEEPSVFTNGAKSKAALIKKRTAELKAAMESTAKPDLWSAVIEAAYKKVPISEALVNGMPDTSTNPDVRSLRQQAIDNITEKGYAKRGELYVHEGDSKPIRSAPVAGNDPQNSESHRQEDINRRREAAGEPPFEKGAPRGWDQVEARAKAKLAANPRLGVELASKFEYGKDTVSDEEHFILGLDYERIQKEMARNHDILADSNGENTPAVKQAERELDRLEDEQVRNQSASFYGHGSNAGRALNARRKAFEANYSQGAMLRKIEASIRRRLDPSDPKDKEIIKKVGEETKRHAEASKAKQKLEDERDKLDSTKAAETAHADGLEEAKKAGMVPTSPEEDSFISRIRSGYSKLKAKAESIIDSLWGTKDKSIKSQQFGGIHDAIVDYATALRSEGANSIDKIRDGFVKRFGEEAVKANLDPVIDRLWEATDAHLDDTIAKTGGNESPAAKKQATARIKKTDEPSAIIANVVERMKVKAGEGKEIRDLDTYTKKVGIQLIRSGIKGREELFDALHEEVKEVFPNVSRQDVVESFSGYGRRKPLTEDPDLLHAMDMAAQGRELSKLDDILVKARAHQVSGIERKAPDPETRRLIKLAKKTIRENPDLYKGSAEGAGRSVEQSIATRLLNEIEEMDEAIANGKPMVSKDGKREYSPENKALLERRNAKRKEYEENFKDVIAANRSEKALSFVENEIAKVKKQIETGNIWPERPDAKEKPTSKEIEAKRTELDTLTKERDALRAADTAHRDEVRLKQLQRVGEQYTKRVAKMDETGQSDRQGKESRAMTPAEVSMREMNKRVQRQVRELQDKLDPFIVEASIKAAQARLASSIAKVDARTALLSKELERIKAAKAAGKPLSRAEIEAGQESLAELLSLVAKTGDQAKLQAIVDGNPDTIKEMTDTLKAKAAAKEKVGMDTRIEEAQLKVRQSEIALKKMQLDLEDASRSKLDKFGEFSSELAKANVLSGPGVFAHLSGAGVAGIIGSHLRTVPVAGARLLAKVWPALGQFLDIATHSGHASWGAEAAMYRGNAKAGGELTPGGLLTKPTRKSVKEKFTKGGGEVDTLYGGEKYIPHGGLHKPTGVGDFVKMTMASVSASHATMKEGPRMAHFGKALTAEWAAAERMAEKSGDPANHPSVNELVKYAVRVRALVHANKEIMMGDNLISNLSLKAMRQAANVEKVSPELAKFLLHTVNIIIPVKRVPTNILSRVLSYGVGSVSGPGTFAIKALQGKLKGFKEGKAKITPDEVEWIVEQTRNGMLGLGVLLAAWAKPDAFGGIFIPGDDTRRKGPLKYGDIDIGKLFGMNRSVTLDHKFAHDPLMLMASEVAQLRKLMDSTYEKTGDMREAYMDSAYMAPFMLLHGEPVYNALSRLSSPYSKPEDKISGIAANILTNKLVEAAFAYGDKDDRGEPIKRQAKTLADKIKVGWGFRDSVAAKQDGLSIEAMAPGYNKLKDGSVPEWVKASVEWNKNVEKLRNEGKLPPGDNWKMFIPEKADNYIPSTSDRDKVVLSREMRDKRTEKAKDYMNTLMGTFKPSGNALADMNRIRENHAKAQKQATIDIKRELMVR